MQSSVKRESQINNFGSVSSRPFLLSVFPLLSSLAQLNPSESVRTRLLADGLVAITCGSSDLRLRGTYVHSTWSDELTSQPSGPNSHICKVLKQTPSAWGWAGFKLLLCTSNFATVTVILKNLVCLLMKSQQMHMKIIMPWSHIPQSNKFLLHVRGSVNEVIWPCLAVRCLLYQL